MPPTPDVSGATPNGVHQNGFSNDNGALLGKLGSEERPIYSAPVNRLPVESILLKAEKFAPFADSLRDGSKFAEEHERFAAEYKLRTLELNFGNFLTLVQTMPEFGATASQRLRLAIESAGVEPPQEGGTCPKYLILGDPYSGGKDALFGQDRAVQRFLSCLGNKTRFIGVFGPNGTGKSTLARLFGKALEAYSLTDTGAVFELGIVDRDGTTIWSESHENPLRIIPAELRPQYLAILNTPPGPRADSNGQHEGTTPRLSVEIDGFVAGEVADRFKELQHENRGDFLKTMESIRVRRVIVSAIDGICLSVIAPAQSQGVDGNGQQRQTPNAASAAPSQPSADAVLPRGHRSQGRVPKITDPLRKVYADGQRGLIEYVEIARLPEKVRTSLMQAAAERILYTGEGQRSVDAVLVAHCTLEDWGKLTKDITFGSRALGVGVGYMTTLAHELRMYRRDFVGAAGGKHLVPHLLESAAMFAVLSRLAPPKHASLSLLQKLKLYNGEKLPGFADSDVETLREDTPLEGLSGVQPRAMQDVLSGTIETITRGYVSPLDLFERLERDLREKAVKVVGAVKQEELKANLEIVRSWYLDTARDEVNSAWIALHGNLEPALLEYIELVKMSNRGEMVREKFTGKMVPPSESVMRAVEEAMDIPESRKHIFRSEVMTKIGAIKLDGKQVDYKTILKELPRLRKGVEAKMGAEAGSTDLEALLEKINHRSMDRTWNERRDRLLSEIIRLGYNDESAEFLLNFVAKHVPKNAPQK